MAKKVIKGFSELNKVLRANDLENYLTKSQDERISYLKENGIIDAKLYLGIYYDKEEIVSIKDVNNPFTGERLFCTLENRNIKINAEEKINVRIIPNKTLNMKTHPNNMFTCIFCSYFKDVFPSRKDVFVNYCEGVPIIKKEEYLNVIEKEKAQRDKERNIAQEERRHNYINNFHKKVSHMFKKDVDALLRNRDIRFLYHFTRIENLLSILNYGIIPSNILEYLCIDSHHNDENRFDMKNGCSCFSIEYPNDKLLQRFMNNLESYVLLRLDARLLCYHECFYAKHNAASKEIAREIMKHNTVSYFEELFQNEISVKLSDRIVYFNRDGLSRYPFLPTSSQAEILVKGAVDTKFIKEIIFFNRSDKEKYDNKLLANKIPLIVDRDLFMISRENYRHFRD